MKSLSALALAVSLALPAHANVGGDPAPASAQLPTARPGDGAIVLAWTQKTVAVNRVLFSDQWKCQLKRGETVYVSSGDSEAEARAILSARVSGTIYCDRNKQSSSSSSNN